MLVYSFVTPLTVGTSTGTSAGSGSYPFYSSCPWSAGYSAANIIGGNPTMSIDPLLVKFQQHLPYQDFLFFAVRVEEYRNGVKIGEVRRDVQYASLPCQLQ